MNTLTVGSGVAIVIISWMSLCVWIEWKYDFPIPFSVGISLVVLFIGSLFIS